MLLTASPRHQHSSSWWHTASAHLVPFSLLLSFIPSAPPTCLRAAHGLLTRDRTAPPRPEGGDKQEESHATGPSYRSPWGPAAWSQGARAWSTLRPQSASVRNRPDDGGRGCRRA